ncbi:MAG: DUF4956 domain-containing protein [Acidobacteriota bacterium]|nr:DUF4956 domain-containing protein [Acidobacteriota bacterium]
MQELGRTLETLQGLADREMEDIGGPIFAIVLVVSTLCASFVSLLYRRTYSERAVGTDIHRAFPLLGLSITAIFICIQFSLPLSLGLLGALSIVRFRTPIKEPEEIGFLMVVIATSLACATFNFVFLSLILIVATVVVVAQELLAGTSGSLRGVVLLSVSAEGFDDKRQDLLDRLETAMPSGRLESLVRNDGEVAISYSFRKLAPQQAGAIEDAVTATVEPLRYSISYQRPLT